ncbi:hypothetical protein Taro_052207 [Colocasia esculenta]|uniref:Uncharacterized protein n=1 Tax=Colocasia esculenta TaxID=4460 RepID=A0A843XIN8_COLES|nr:hypothetical protein [Colocasia esculenta]
MVETCVGQRQEDISSVAAQIIGLESVEAEEVHSTRCFSSSNNEASSKTTNTGQGETGVPVLEEDLVRIDSEREE